MDELSKLMTSERTLQVAGGVVAAVSVVLVVKKIFFAR